MCHLVLLNVFEYFQNHGFEKNCLQGNGRNSHINTKRTPF